MGPANQFRSLVCAKSKTRAVRMAFQARMLAVKSREIREDPIERIRDSAAMQGLPHVGQKDKSLPASPERSRGREIRTDPSLQTERRVCVRGGRKKPVTALT